MSVTVRFSDGDIEFGSGGEQTLVSNEEKAAQDLLEAVLMPFNPERDEGNEMFSAEDGSLSVMASAPGFGSAFIKSSLSSTVRRLQRAQANSSLTDQSEFIQDVKEIIVQPVRNDPTAYAFLLAVRVNSKNIALARAIKTTHLGTPDISSLGVTSR